MPKKVFCYTCKQRVPAVYLVFRCLECRKQHPICKGCENRIVRTELLHAGYTYGEGLITTCPTLEAMTAFTLSSEGGV